MSILQAIILGVVQGVTEFVPISSSAHLVILPEVLGWPQPSLAFDVMLHLGSLLAVLVYFRDDLPILIQSFFRGIFDKNNRKDAGFRLSFLIVVSTIPTVIIAILFNDFFERLFASPISVSVLLILTGVTLSFAERLGKRERGLTSMQAKDSILIGLAQGLAVAPGISRSGATISTGLFLGLDRTSSARFSFLLSIPIILGAAASKIPDFLKLFIPGQISLLAFGFASALLSGYLCIKFLLSFLKSRGLYVFSYYCIMAGALFLLSKAI
ncbi:MAG: undecaprenyl-diphosphatase UppP [Actinomycetota bacterium]|nr:undecaprenyl-diphosphatase UppP [Actinomycetota bacterium]